MTTFSDLAPGLLYNDGDRPDPTPGLLLTDADRADIAKFLAPGANRGNRRTAPLRVEIEADPAGVPEIAYLYERRKPEPAWLLSRRAVDVVELTDLRSGSAWPTTIKFPTTADALAATAG